VRRIYNIENKILKETPAKDGQVLLFINPSEEEKKFLTTSLEIDEHTLMSALDPEELSRLEFEPKHTALILKRPRNYSGKDQLLFKVASMGLFLFQDKLVIVISEDIALFVGKRFKKIDDIRDVFIKIIYNSISHYIEHLKVINMISEEIEQKITESVNNKYLYNLFSLEKSLVYYVNAINSNGFVFEKMNNSSKKIGFDIEDKEILEDIIVENNQCRKQAEIYSNILTSLITARSSIVSNNLNLLIKHLNTITIWIMVPTFVVSAFSVNVNIPMQHHPNAFWMIMGLAVISVWLMINYWKYRNW
jgi:magnesium transporter